MVYPLAGKVVLFREAPGRLWCICPLIDDMNLVALLSGDDLTSLEDLLFPVELVGEWLVEEILEDHHLYIGKADLAPVYSKPNVRFFVQVNDFKAFYALEYCNIHGVWENCLEVDETKPCCCCS